MNWNVIKERSKCTLERLNLGRKGEWECEKENKQVSPMSEALAAYDSAGESLLLVYKLGFCLLRNVTL